MVKKEATKNLLRKKIGKIEIWLNEKLARSHEKVPPWGPTVPDFVELLFGLVEVAMVEVVNYLVKIDFVEQYLYYMQEHHMME